MEAENFLRLNPNQQKEYLSLVFAAVTEFEKATAEKDKDVEGRFDLLDMTDTLAKNFELFPVAYADAQFSCGNRKPGPSSGQKLMVFGGNLCNYSGQCTPLGKKKPVCKGKTRECDRTGFGCPPKGYAQGNPPCFPTNKAGRKSCVEAWSDPKNCVTRLSNDQIKDRFKRLTVSLQKACNLEPSGTQDCQECQILSARLKDAEKQFGTPTGAPGGRTRAGG